MDENEHCACDLEIPTHAAPTYRRALWVVAGLNLGMGVVESVSGYLAGSQSLKADALDFLGDGIITGLGLIALNWGTNARAYTALVQGVFLALMGLGVLVFALYRIWQDRLCSWSMKMSCQQALRVTS